MNGIRRGAPIPQAERARLQAAINRHGLKVVLAAGGGIGRGALTAALAGLPVLAGSAALVRQALDRLEREEQRLAQAVRVAR